MHMHMHTMLSTTYICWRRQETNRAKTSVQDTPGNASKDVPQPAKAYTRAHAMNNGTVNQSLAACVVIMKIGDDMGLYVQITSLLDTE
jgi:hypothetical protein